MNKLTQKLEEITKADRPAFMMHIVAGYPDMEASEQIAKTILDAGADLLEIQMPFSDPVADGPIIAQANETSLAAGATVKASLDMIERIATSTTKPILIMSYFNIIHKYGVEKVCRKAMFLGVQGLIVPDYPHDEEDGNLLMKFCRENSLALIQVLVSTTKAERIKKISAIAKIFNARTVLKYSLP